MASSISVLWVDDASGMQLIYSTLLRALDLSAFRGAGTAERALSLVRDHRFNLVLLVETLPDGDGLPLARDIRTSRGPSSGARIVLVSGRDSSHLRRHRDAMHVDAFLIKPVTARALRHELLQLPVDEAHGS